MGDEVLVCAYSEDNHRHAMLVDDGITGILYLHAPSDDAEKAGEVEATCFAYNRVDPIDTKDVQRYRPGPPPICLRCSRPLSTSAVPSNKLDEAGE